jgi:hypothetical protein
MSFERVSMTSIYPALVTCGPDPRARLLRVRMDHRKVAQGELAVARVRGKTSAASILKELGS